MRAERHELSETVLRIGIGVNRIIGEYRRDVISDPEPLVPLPTSGRTFTQVRKVRLGDVRPDGILRFDALIRYAQDVSNDDTTDADLADDLDWVARRTVVDVFERATFGETLTFTTFCSGLGSCWAERRLHVRGDRGAHLEIATLWVHLDAATGRPRRLSDQFLSLYGEAAAGRKVRARLELGPPPPSAPSVDWPVRVVDFDIVGHMNNAAYWAAVEEAIADHAVDDRRCRAEVEYAEGVGPGTSVGLVVDIGPDGTASLWWMAGDSASPAAAGRLVPAAFDGAATPAA